METQYSKNNRNKKTPASEREFLRLNVPPRSNTRAVNNNYHATVGNMKIRKQAVQDLPVSGGGASKPTPISSLIKLNRPKSIDGVYGEGQLLRQVVDDKKEYSNSAGGRNSVVKPDDLGDSDSESVELNADTVLDEKPKARFSLKNYLLYATAVVTIGVTGYVSYYSWLTNRQVEGAASSSEVLSDSTDRGDYDENKDKEGSDTKKISNNVIGNFQVSPDHPRVLRISKLKIEARTLQMGVNKDGSMQAPINIYDAGWYKGSSKPGQAGAVVIDAHAGGGMGLLGHADSLVEGDIIEIEIGSGDRYRYKVVKKEIPKLEDVDMSKVMLPYGSDEGLNIITCDGDPVYVNGEKTRDHRLVIYAKRI